MQEDILVQEAGDITEDSIYTGRLDPNGSLIVNSKGLKKKPKEVDLFEANLWVEQRPNDANRTKALTSNYLMWTEDSRIDSLDHRVCIQSEKDLKTQNYVGQTNQAIYTKTLTEAKNIMAFLLIRTKHLDQSRDLVTFSIVKLTKP